MKHHHFSSRIAGCIMALALVTASVSGCSGPTDPIGTPEATLNPDDQELLDAVSGRDENLPLTPDERESIASRLLENCVFYQGRATISEQQSWVSRGTDGSSGRGDTTISADEILAYERETRKCYIIVRYMSASGWHNITVNDLQGNFLQNADVYHFGELYEYYGTGLLSRKTYEDAVASNIDQYLLNFGANPVRMENNQSLIFTYPLPRQVDWVTYVSIAGTDRRGGIRAWPPEENYKNTELDLIPSLTQIQGSNSYNSDESWLYEATDRIWTPVGTFSYDYQQISYRDALSEIDEIRREAEAAGAFGAMAYEQPPAWQQTAALADGIQAVASTSNDLEMVVDSLLPQDIIDALEARNAADALSNEKALKERLKVFEEGIAHVRADAADADSSSLRKLEGVVIETSEESDAGVQQKNLKQGFNAVRESLDKLVTQYVSIYETLQEKISELRNYPAFGPDFPEQQAVVLLAECREQLQTAVKLNELANNLLADTYGVLYDLNAKGDVDDEVRYGELNRLFELWEVSFNAAENISVDVEHGVGIPDDYPAHVIPILQGAVVALVERIPGEGGPDGFALSLKTNLSIDEAVEYYETFLNDIPDVESFTFSGVTTLSGVRDGYDFGILITSNQLGGTEPTMVQITLTPSE